jgi:hypothetical protein
MAAIGSKPKATGQYGSLIENPELLRRYYSGRYQDPSQPMARGPIGGEGHGRNPAETKPVEKAVSEPDYESRTPTTSESDEAEKKRILQKIKASF